jgi:hypothetical protein
METYMRFFEDKGQARDFMKEKNRACVRAGNRSDCYCVVDGPEDNFAVVDIDTAIELGGQYEWAI